MRIDLEGRKYIYNEEGVRLKAYKDVAGIPTIGVGFTYYPGTGKKVQIGDVYVEVLYHVHYYFLHEYCPRKRR